MSVTLPTELSSIWITGGLATFMERLRLPPAPRCSPTRSRPNAKAASWATTRRYR